MTAGPHGDEPLAPASAPDAEVHQTNRSEPAIRSPLVSLWALFSGVGLMSMSHGLQGTLLGVRASIEGFDSAAIGVIMAAYYVGFIGGTRFTVQALGRVGHVRVFSALAATGASSTLGHILWVQPAMWVVLRLITGFCLAGLYVIAESWLNDHAGNTNRRRVLSLYMMTTMGAVAVSQALLTIADPEGPALFIASSMLLSMSLVPMALSEVSAPRIVRPVPLPFRELWRIVPTGAVVIFLTGVSVGALRSLGPVYAADIGLRSGEIAAFVGATTLGAALFQPPLGFLAERLPRRMLMALMASGAAAVALALVWYEPSTPMLMVSIFVLGGLAIPMYSLSIAYTNDWLRDDQRVSAAALLILLNSAGAVIGPLIAGFVIGATSPDGFFGTLVVTHALAGLYLLYRMLRTKPPSAADRSRFHPLTNRGARLAVLSALEDDREDG